MKKFLINSAIITLRDAKTGIKLSESTHALKWIKIDKCQSCGESHEVNEYLKVLDTNMNLPYHGFYFCPNTNDMCYIYDDNK